MSAVRTERPTGRIAAIDVVRGVAILGTLGTNIWIFTHPSGPFSLFPDTTGVAGAVETGLRAVANGKFLALLTLLFGVGLELQYRSAVRRGMRWPGRYLWRAALLFVEGLLHYVLVFEYDVLMSYAVTSMLVAYLIGRSDRAQRSWMVMAGALHVLLVAGGTAGQLTNPWPQTNPSTALYTSGSWLDQVHARLTDWAQFRAEAMFILPMSVLLFLAGARLLRAGAFAADGQPLRNRLMAWGFGLGLPLNALTTAAGPGWALVDRYLVPPIVAIGLLGLVPTILFGLRGDPGPLHRGLTSVGRTALSCYVFQNLVASIVCYGWGFGLAARFDEFRPWWVFGLWAAICATFMVLATWWLRHFERGPLEAAWNWAYQRPFRDRS
ncbi:DUF418 domain-containing protein [Saccharopolyspora sp. CA-218241]|uniref:DUF418 domain-containing protein n=1 Tax=Saccharopolyspora sp. CA-218241 TaxID=3240027 RepID=UPI003D95397A